MAPVIQSVEMYLPPNTLVFESFNGSLSTSIFLASKSRERKDAQRGKSLLVSLYKEIEAALYKPNAESICRQYSQKKKTISYSVFRP